MVTYAKNILRSRFYGRKILIHEDGEIISCGLKWKEEVNNCRRHFLSLILAINKFVEGFMPKTFHIVLLNVHGHIFDDFYQENESSN